MSRRFATSSLNLVAESEPIPEQVEHSRGGQKSSEESFGVSVARMQEDQPSRDYGYQGHKRSHDDFVSVRFSLTNDTSVMRAR